MADQVNASHILLMYAGSSRSTATRTKEEALELINKYKADIDGGADFAEIAKESSDCPSGNDGGSLGLFGRGQMVPEFDEAAFNLEVGGLSDVVETDFGYHLITRTA
ncbi:MAG: peptidylprolyl isomerase [Alphaproteobacteria bacterium]|nr:peptidylprolyl isomerase [Alphaproteobacteria bacterium]